MASIVNNTYSCASGETINAGRTVTTPLAAFIAGMSAGSWAEYTGTNINDPLAGADSPSGGPYSSLETVANYPLTVWANKWFYDPSSKLIGGIGTAQGYSSESPAGTHGKCVWFDLVTGTPSAETVLAGNGTWVTPQKITVSSTAPASPALNDLWLQI